LGPRQARVCDFVDRVNAQGAGRPDLDLGIEHVQGGEPGNEPAAVPQARTNEAEDALRRTRLANERTYLAWWRTGFTTFAVSFGAGKLVPELAGGAAWPFELIGTAFGVVGIALIAYAYIRQKRVEEALGRGDYAPFDPRAALICATAGVMLGLGTIIIVVVGYG
jgi:putative membrane protein